MGGAWHEPRSLPLPDDGACVLQNKSLKVDEELHTRIKALAKKNKMSMQQFTTKILMEGIYGMEA